jgi:hypothetical protein
VGPALGSLTPFQIELLDGMRSQAHWFPAPSERKPVRFAFHCASASSANVALKIISSSVFVPVALTVQVFVISGWSCRFWPTSGESTRTGIPNELSVALGPMPDRSTVQVNGAFLISCKTQLTKVGRLNGTSGQDDLCRRVEGVNRTGSRLGELHAAHYWLTTVTASLEDLRDLRVDKNVEVRPTENGLEIFESCTRAFTVVHLRPVSQHPFN